jgi:pyruvate decarboxylase
MQFIADIYLATRFSQLCLKHHFIIAADYNLALLDRPFTSKDLEQVYCATS